jgi:hypothetical protein
MKRHRLDEDARSRRNRNNDEDSSAQWMPPPPDDDNISLLSFSQTHPEDDIGEGYPSDLEHLSQVYTYLGQNVWIGPQDPNQAGTD